jgi:hypothetical protein
MRGTMGPSTGSGGTSDMPGPKAQEAAPKSTAVPGAPKAGDVMDGYKFKGGDPADKANWEKVSSTREGKKYAETTKIPWSALSSQEQQALIRNSYVPKTEGEMNKYDDTLARYGSVVLPSKAIFGADEWQDKSFSPDVQRYDLPDGRVILKRVSNLVA